MPTATPWPVLEPPLSAATARAMPKSASMRAAGASLEQHVLRLHVAVHHAGPAGRVERRGQVGHDPGGRRGIAAVPRGRAAAAGSRPPPRPSRSRAARRALPAAWTATMLGCRSRAMVRASARKRRAMDA